MMIQKNLIKAMYIHIPFCSSICSYCDFCKMFYNEKMVNDYLKELKKEFLFNYKEEVISTIYIGGGTPSSLKMYQLEKLFEIIDEVNVSKDLEFTVEVNVCDITEELLIFLKENKVNRLSIGVESINQKHLLFLNRFHTKDEVMSKFKLARKYFSNINIDLMYAFPNQSVDELMEDLSFVVSLNPEHISIYSLMIEEHTKLYIEKVEPIDSSLDSKMYYEIIKHLENSGYNHYEISNFSKVGFESRHNLVYWNNQEYYGFGLGASGYVNGYRYTNTRSISNYLKGKYIVENELVNNEMKMEYEMILGLRKMKGVSISEFFSKYNFNIYEIFDIMDLVNKKLLTVEDGYVFIPFDKIYISNSILINFIGGSNGKDG